MTLTTALVLYCLSGVCGAIIGAIVARYWRSNALQRAWDDGYAQGYEQRGTDAAVPTGYDQPALFSEAEITQLADRYAEKVGKVTSDEWRRDMLIATNAIMSYAADHPDRPIPGMQLPPWRPGVQWFKGDPGMDTSAVQPEAVTDAHGRDTGQTTWRPIQAPRHKAPHSRLRRLLRR